ncbi:hypothetical protein [Maribacter polysaccharolyticus]|uniref:hypothetical protein n=1 Tax=Maribacter polysaccharolyticus TaxID=3020831 RepID=UPI00237F2683|nr:hypothetical protein [Maribacter polysaccharolyticus]MDE3741084.1 hypothetical protein [Maribacter polysaccharolyticus]
MKIIKQIIVLGFFSAGIIYELLSKLFKIMSVKTVQKKLSIGIVFLTIGATTIACTSTKGTNADDPTIAIAEIVEEFKIEKSGAQMWGETCNRCHLAPSPADYNDTDWETISLHMRVRANITENQITKIEEFLKSAN